MKTSYNTKNHSAISLFLFAFVASVLFACNPDDPEKEDAPELITRVTLTFTPTDGSAVIEVNATDPDGEGVADIAADDDIVLNGNKTYDLSVSLFNDLAGIDSPDYNIGNEVEEESDEHLLLFGWTEGLFSTPSGNGNVDNRTDPVSYTDTDSKNLPLGLTTRWTTTAAGLPASGTFRVILKHQPGQKTATSGNSVGETDLDVSFTVTVQ